MFSLVMKVDFIWIIQGTQCGSHPEFSGQQESARVSKTQQKSEGILELRKL
jgi:hypothetical protein